MYGGYPWDPRSGVPRYRGIPVVYPQIQGYPSRVPRYRGIPVVYPQIQGYPSGIPQIQGSYLGVPPGIPYPWDCPIKGSSRHGSGGTPRSGGYPQDPHSRKSSLGGGPWGPRSIASGALYCTPGTNFFGERGSSRHGSKAKMGQSSEVCLGALS